MKSFTEFTELNESIKGVMRGDDVRVTKKDHKYHGKMGVVLKVDGKKFTVKFSTGESVDFVSVKDVEVIEQDDEF